ncbi:hypothetical protein [Wenjunlia tyrosinilytica]|uniref:Fic family toxin-antitoxin system, toxin component n=1 Tax=Wenjunlia tyrosinilytica TaxID=1544741 RepID=A0A918DUK7_9ACTN|nr:hypothetical protein [Wenjunlia tyrosinilytica]GGO83846.1 hypothetical protein GCM10012280_13950 [Wenjunlia tyrosinilytica]
MNLRVDLAWLLSAAQILPGDPLVCDYGVLAGAETRHAARIMDKDVYDKPHHKAAALLHTLVRTPALEHSNALYAVAVARAYLTLSGLSPKPRRGEASALALDTEAGRKDVREIARVLHSWTA